MRTEPDRVEAYQQLSVLTQTMDTKVVRTLSWAGVYAYFSLLEAA
jgi:hypothetical protein